jgi:GNAT superfamily N-acetyltransferase
VVAEIDAWVIGWAEVLPPTAGVSILDHLWVEPGSMRAGVGSRLFRHAGGWARARGAAVMEWEAEPHALGFYAKMGGRQVRTATSEWGRELTVMAVDLQVAITAPTVAARNPRAESSSATAGRASAVRRHDPAAE